MSDCPPHDLDYFPPTGETFCVDCAEIISRDYKPKYVFERLKQDIYIRFKLILSSIGIYI